MSEPNKVEHVRHEVILQQIMTSLQDKSKVALLLTEDDLELVIRTFVQVIDDSSEIMFREQDFLDSLSQLKREAFQT